MRGYDPRAVADMMLDEADRNRQTVSDCWHQRSNHQFTDLICLGTTFEAANLPCFSAYVTCTALLAVKFLGDRVSYRFNIALREQPLLVDGGTQEILHV